MYVSYIYFLAESINNANGFSQVYILITWIPFIISFISRTLSSVRAAVFKRIDVNLPPNQ